MLAVVQPTYYTEPIACVVGQFRESGLASFLRAIGQAVRVAVSAQERFPRSGPQRAACVGMAAKVASG